MNISKMNCRYSHGVLTASTKFSAINFLTLCNNLLHIIWQFKPFKKNNVLNLVPKQKKKNKLHEKMQAINISNMISIIV